MIETKENYFKELNKIECKTEKKKNLTYISWADAWAEVKKQYPDSNYMIYENSEWFPFWESKFWIDCKVGVTINWVEHIIRLPVMDWANKAMKLDTYSYKTKYWEKTCEWATQFDINKTIMRAFAKAIAMHGVWLYVFRWEDLPTDEDNWTETIKATEKKTFKNDKLDIKDFIDRVKDETDENALLRIYTEAKALDFSDKQIDWLTKECGKRKEYLQTK